MKLKINSEELVKAKFTSTIAAVEAVIAEARGDIPHGTTYSAKAVYNRANRIKDALEEDIKNLAADIEL